MNTRSSGPVVAAESGARTLDMAREISAMKRQMAAMEAAFAARLEAAENEIAQLRAQNADLLSMVGAADKKAAAADTKQDALTNKVADVVARHNAFSHEVKVVRDAIARLDSGYAELQSVSAAISHEVKVVRHAGPAGQPAAPATSFRARAPSTGVVAAPPANTPVVSSNAARVVVASACPEVHTKQDALAHATQAVCLVGALDARCVLSAQLVAGGRDLMLQGQAARPSYSSVARGTAGPEPVAAQSAAEVAATAAAQPRQQWLVEVVLANTQMATMVLRDAHKLAGVRGMEHTFVRRSLTHQQLKLKHRLVAAYAAKLQEARTGTDTRVRFKDDMHPCIQRRNADGQWRTVQVFVELPAPAAPAGTGDGADAALPNAKT